MKIITGAVDQLAELTDLKSVQDGFESHGRYICENCGINHQIKFGSGRFCSVKCKNVFAGKHSGGSRPNRGSYKKSLVQKDTNGNMIKSKWYCKVCKTYFITRELLMHHKRDNNHKTNHTEWHKKELRKCKWCGKIKDWTASNYQLHQNLCSSNPNKREHNWTGKHHSEASKRKKRIAAINNINLIGKGGPRFNKNACEYIDQLNIEKGWNLQHALNGGEFTIDGYFIDGYDKKLNIAFEYDEPSHYLDLNKNKLANKDIIRQQNIVNILKCEFWRYNEYTKQLYKAS